MPDGRATAVHPVDVLVVGGAGYIGAHVVRSLSGQGHRVSVLDDLSTGDRDRLDDALPLIVGSVLNTGEVIGALRAVRPHVVVHLAARKAVEESVRDPLSYYEHNICGMRSLLSAMTAVGVRRLVFSSSAAVYGPTASGRVAEDAPTAPVSPYGRTKLVCEWMLRDTAASTGLSWAALRYFNVAGTATARLADHGTDNLVPRVLRAVSSGERPVVFGGRHATPDGTCIRDYVHVDDLAEAHAKVVAEMAFRDLQAVYNIGGGHGVSVLDVLRAARRATGIPFDWEVAGARVGDAPCVIADPSLVARHLGWRARRGIDDIVSSAWQALTARTSELAAAAVRAPRRPM